MNKTDELALELHEEITDNDIYINYHYSLKNIKDNPHLLKQEEQLKAVAKKIVQLKKDPNSDVSSYLTLYRNLNAQFIENPAVANYIQDFDQYRALCLEIKKTIEGQLD